MSVLRASDSPSRSRLRRLLRGVGLLLLIGTVSVLAVAWLLRAEEPVLPLRAVIGKPGSEACPFAFSPDGAMLAVSYNRLNAVVIYEVATGRVRSRITPAQVFNNDAAISLDGRLIAIPRSTPRSVAVYDTATGSRVAQLSPATPDPNSGFFGLTFTADGSRFTAVEYSSGTTGNVYTVRTWETSGWKVRGGPTWTAAQPARLILSPDGGAFDVEEPASSAVNFYKIRTGSAAGTLPMPEGLAVQSWWPRFSPDGRRLIGVTPGGTLAVWDVPSRGFVSELRGHTKGYRPVLLGFGPDPGTLASMGMNIKPPRNWTHGVRQAASEVVSRLGFDWQPTQDYPVEVIIWDVVSGRPRHILKGKGNPVISPDGRTLATSEIDGTVKLWALDDAQAPALLGGSKR
jgi:WD40 repeat protein